MRALGPGLAVALRAVALLAALGAGAQLATAQPGSEARSTPLPDAKPPNSQAVELRGQGTQLSPTPLGITATQLSDLHAQLGQASAERRQAALSELLALGDDDLAGIRARLHALSAGKLDLAAAVGKLPTLRRTRAVEVKATPEDQAVGLAAALEQDRAAPMLAAVELYALLRALETQRSIAASEVIVNDLFALEPRLFRGELARDRKRLGKLLVPGLLRARAQGGPALQKLARDGLAALGLSAEPALFAQADPELLAAIVRVLSELGAGAGLHDALPWIVSLLDDSRPVVRAAARRAAQAHADEALDLLRQRMTDLVGEEPDPTWDALHLLERLEQQTDAARDRAAVQALAKAQPALRTSDLGAVERQLELSLAAGGSPAVQALAAATYLELADKYDQRDDMERALITNRRALRLARADSAEAKQARARVLYLEAEQRAGRGIADLASLQTAAQLEPGRPAAWTLLQELRGTRIEREHALRKWLGLAAAGLLAIAAMLLLYIRAQARRERLGRGSPGLRTTKSPST
ncbi:MAG: hypothetical protein JWN48_643 [Myxococcaceae bacterium]|nr:hypothetical protein [Myxococcaceae bacterium]